MWNLLSGLTHAEQLQVASDDVNVKYLSPQHDSLVKILFTSLTCLC